MKTILAIILSCASVITYGQDIYYNAYGSSSHKLPPPTSLPEDIAHQLSIASEEMFVEGNPRYFFVDIVKDGFIPLSADSVAYSFRISSYTTDLTTNEAHLHIPAKLRAQYAKKYIQFISKLGESFHNEPGHSVVLYAPLDFKDITDKNSSFRTDFKRDLFNARLINKGKELLIKEFIKDGYANLDDTINFSFNNKGFVVNHKTMDKLHREKYMSLCKQEFGQNFYEDYVSWSLRTSMTCKQALNELQNDEQ